MKLSQFKFDLPLNLIAQHPTKKREDARMMVVHRRTGQIENRHFRDVMEYFDDKDVFVVNNTKVFPARMCSCVFLPALRSKKRRTSVIVRLLGSSINPSKGLGQIWMSPLGWSPLATHPQMGGAHLC